MRNLVSYYDSRVPIYTLFPYIESDCARRSQYIAILFGWTIARRQARFFLRFYLQCSLDFPMYIFTYYQYRIKVFGIFIWTLFFLFFLSLSLSLSLSPLLPVGTAVICSSVLFIFGFPWNSCDTHSICISIYLPHEMHYKWRKKKKETRRYRLVQLCATRVCVCVCVCVLQGM